MSNNRKNLLFLAILTFIAAYLRPLPSISLMGRDETSYAFLIKHILNGTFLDDYIFYAFHPLFAFIAAPISALGINPELAGRIVSYVMGAAAVIPVYFIGTTLFSTNSGFIAGFITAIFPPLIKQAGTVMSETTFTVFLLTGTLFLILFVKHKKFYFAVFMGIFSSFAYLTRAEGFGFFILNIVLCFAFIISNKFDKRQLIKGICFMILFFFVVSFPYIYALKQRTGEWKFSDKTITAVATSIVVAENLDYEKYMYGKSSISKAELIKKAFLIYPKKLFELTRGLEQYFGFFTTIAAILTIIFCIFFRIERTNLLFFVPFGIFLLMLPFFPSHERIVVPYAPFVFLLCGQGIAKIDGFFQNKYKFFAPVLIVIFLGFFTYGYAFRGFEKKIPANTAPKYDFLGMQYQAYRDFGREISPIINPDSKIISRFNIVVWYAGGEFEGFPDVPLNEFLNQLKERKIDYIVLGPAEQGMRTEIFNYIYWATKGNAKDGRFILVKRAVYFNFYEFLLIKVNA